MPSTTIATQVNCASMLLVSALVMGSIKTGAIMHDMAFGGEVFHRNVHLPGSPPADAPSTVQNGAVYAYVGSENIYQPNMSFPIESPVQSAGPVQLADFESPDCGDCAGSHAVCRVAFSC